MNRRILVVTPTLGVSPFLEQTVASVARQSVGCQHVMVAPQGRREELEVRFPQALVLPDAGPRGGLYGALNVALAEVGDQWDWFTYINDDDALLPGFGEMLHRHEQGAEAPPVAYGDVELADGDGSKIALITTARNPRAIPALLQQGISPLMQQGMLFHRTVVRKLRGFDTRYRLCADLDFWLRAYAGGARLRYYPITVARFRLRSGQLSGNTAETQREQDEIVSRHLPTAVAPWRRRLARLRYRTENLPRYLARLRRRGWRTSYQLLGEGGRS